MTTIDALAEMIRAEFFIEELEAARRVAGVLVDQIADDPDLWDADTDTLTRDGVELVMDAAEQSFRQGQWSTAALQLLDQLEDTAAAIKAAKLEAKRVIDEQIERRDRLVQAALRTELPRARIAEAAGVTESRLYQIRDGRR